MFNKRSSGINSSRGGRSNAHNQGVSTSKGSNTGKSSSVNVNNTPETPEIGPAIPHLKIQDNARLLPKYTASLARPKNEYLPAEDLDALQFELETLLSNVALRYRVLKSEYESLEKDDKKDKKRLFVEKQPTSPGKRKRGADEKKSKEKALLHFKMAKQKNASVHSPAQSQHTDDSMDATSHYSHHHHHHHHQKDHTKLALPKNDTPNKFWLSIEPYCMPITNEDLKLLDDLLEQYSGPLAPTIPELGPHYTSAWSIEDLKEEQDNSSLSTKSKTKHGGSNNDALNMMKRSEKIMGEGVSGPLTQRLVSAVIEENIINENFANNDSNGSSENTATSANSLRTLSMMKNGIGIEKRLRKELIEQGILELDDLEKEQDDEIHSEIKRVITELLAIAEFNSTALKKLRSAAEAELQRLEVKRKLDVVDHEIIEMYKKVAVARQKRMQITNEDQKEIYRLIGEQKRLSEQLESMGVPGPDYNNI